MKIKTIRWPLVSALLFFSMGSANADLDRRHDKPTLRGSSAESRAHASTGSLEVVGGSGRNDGRGANALHDAPPICPPWSYVTCESKSVAVEPGCTDRDCVEERNACNTYIESFHIPGQKQSCRGCTWTGIDGQNGYGDVAGTCTHK